MKKALIILFSISFVALLTSCASVNGRCGSQYGCCQTAVSKYPCKVIKDRCQKVCDSCTYNGPACTTCWSCVNYIGCNGSCSDCS